MDDQSENSEVPNVKPIKPKRVMTEAQMEVLKRAREKAREARLRLGDITKREKEAKQKLLDDRIKKIERIEDVVKPKIPKATKAKVESESETETESDSSDDEPTRPPTPIPRRAKPVKANTRRVTDERLTSQIAREELKERILRETYKQAFQSIFPNQNNPYY